MSAQAVKAETDGNVSGYRSVYTPVEFGGTGKPENPEEEGIEDAIEVADPSTGTTDETTEEPSEQVGGTEEEETVVTESPEEETTSNEEEESV